MRTTTLLLSFVLLAGCSGAAEDGPAGSPGVMSPTDDARAESPIDLTSLSGRIVFDDFQDVWSVDADGTQLRRLTRSPWPEFDPSLSPDGRFIAYRAEPNGQPQLWIMHADGSGKRRLARDGGFPTWSPDGSMIAYAPGGGPSGRSWIAIMNADGSGQRRLPRTDFGEDPSWS